MFLSLEYCGKKIYQITNICDKLSLVSGLNDNITNFDIFTTMGKDTDEIRIGKIDDCKCKFRLKFV